ncbi:MAG: protein tyrosine phosphatase family protein [Leptolyngbyaceae cyanobacterium]
MLQEIYKYVPITDTLATAGQPTESQFADIKQAGFQVVINLALPTSTNALPDERTVVAGQGMRYYPIPVIWEQPTLADFQQFQAVLAEHAGQKVFVHCAMNMRVSAFVYLHRRLQGVPRAEAEPAMARIWQPNNIWQTFIDEMLEPDSVPTPSASEAAQD